MSIGLGEVLIVGGNLLCIIVFAFMVLVVIKGRPEKYDDDQQAQQ